MSARLTKVQRAVLAYMFVSNWVYYADDNDRTMLALKRRGLVGYSAGGKYRRAHWGLTDAGVDEFRRRVSHD
jgi:hypothetical protein